MSASYTPSKIFRRNPKRNTWLTNDDTQLEALQKQKSRDLQANLQTLHAVMKAASDLLRLWMRQKQIQLKPLVLSDLFLVRKAKIW